MKIFLEQLKKHFSKELSSKKFDYCFLNPKNIFFSKTLNLKIKKIKDKYYLKIIFPKNFKSDIPLILCFGIFENKGNLLVYPEIIIEKNSFLKIFSFCLFPKAKKVFHQMQGKITLKEKSELIFEEKHFHGISSGTNLDIFYEISCQKNSKLNSSFYLTQGTSGKVKLKYQINQFSQSFLESKIKILTSHKNDIVEIEEKVFLLQKKAKANLKLRGIAKSKSLIKLIGEIEAQAPYCFGHLDCKEIICDKKSQVIAIPKLKVLDPLASLTHESAIGRINPHQIALLTSKGLSEKQAIDFILKGLLK